MNNTTTLNWNIHEDYLENVIFYYGCGPINAIGIITCLISVLIFNSSKFSGKYLFSYIKFECIFMLVDLTMGMMLIFISPKQWPISQTLISKILAQYLYSYIGNIAEMCAIFSNIFAAICCFNMILGNQQFLEKKNRILQCFINTQPKIITLTSVLFASIVFIYELFDNDADGLFAIEFFRSNLKNFDFMAFTICDGLLVLVLLAVNYLIAFKIRKLISKKRTIIGLQRHLFSSGEVIVKAKQRNLTKLILVDSVNTIVGRLPILVYFISNLDPLFTN